MGVLEVLLVIFIVLKLLGVVTWSWGLVLLPLWIDLVIYVLAFGIALVVGSTRKVGRSWKV